MFSVSSQRISRCDLYLHSAHLSLIYRISNHFSRCIVFMNPIQKMLRSLSVYTTSCTDFGEESVLDSYRAM